MERAYEFRAEIDDELGRKTKIERNYPTPSWVLRIGSYIASAEISRRQEQESDYEHSNLVVDHFKSKFNSLTESVPFASESDIKAFESLTQSVRHFWPEISAFRAEQGTGMDNNAIKSVIDSDPEIFVETVKGWMNNERDPSKSVSPEAVSAWFDSIGGLASSDPVILGKLFSFEVAGKIPPLGGISASNRRSVLSEIFQLQEERGGKTTFDNIRIFAEKSAELFREEARKGGSDVMKYLQIASSADRLDKFLTISWEGGHKETDLLVPTPAEYSIFPAASALTDKLHSVDWQNDESQVEEIAKGMTRLYRRRRTGVTENDLMVFCGAFRDPEEVKMLKFSNFAGWGLNIFSRLSGYENGEVDYIHSKLMPEFIYQMRFSGFYLFEWTIDHYKRLGFTESLWVEHKQRLENEKHGGLVMGPEVVASGDDVAELSGEFGGPQVGHEQVIAEVAAMSRDALARAGLINSEFDGKFLLGIRVNNSNTTKLGDKNSVDPLIRWKLTAKSVMGIDNVFLYPPDDVKLPTAQRMWVHLSDFARRGIYLYDQPRLVGFDKPDMDADFTYTEEKEPGGSDSLNSKTHIFTLQIDDLTNLDNLGSRIRMAFKDLENGKQKFNGKVLVLLVALSDVHSSYIKAHLDELSDEALAVLMNPQIVEDFKQIYAKV